MLVYCITRPQSVHPYSYIVRIERENFPFDAFYSRSGVWFLRSEGRSSEGPTTADLARPFPFHWTVRVQATPYFLTIQTVFVGIIQSIVGWSGTYLIADTWL